MKRNLLSIIKISVLLLLIPIMLTACKKSSNKLKDQASSLDRAPIKTPFENDKKLKRIILKKMTLQDIGKIAYDYKYDDEEMSGEYTIFKPEGMSIKKLEVIEIDGKKEKVLKTIDDIENDESLLLDIVYRQEANRKIKWISADGDKGEYSFKNNDSYEEEVEFTYR